MTAITLRKLLNGELLDFVGEAVVDEIVDCPMVCELVSLIADYQEEGKSLFLDVYVVHDLASFLAPIPGHALVHLGTAPKSEAGIKQTLKKSGPLVCGPWTMYLTRSHKGKEHIDFGVFMDSGNLLNVPLETAIKTSNGFMGKYIRITKIAQDVVDLTSHNGTKRTVHFTTSKDEIVRDGNLIEDLAKLICSDVVEAHSQTTASYLSTVLGRGIRNAHGTLVAVTGVEDFPFIRDATLFEPPLDIATSVMLAKESPSALPRLFSLEALIGGMMCSDGIIVFNTSGHLLGYNWFVDITTAGEIGGARKRAYATLCGYLEKGLAGAFFQSQDGSQDLKTTNK